MPQFILKAEKCMMSGSDDIYVFNAIVTLLDVESLALDEGVVGTKTVLRARLTLVVGPAILVQSWILKGVAI
jgi:hypothetical protein